MAKDPVCGMDVDPTQTEWSTEYNGKIYYFCAPGCQRAFEKEPEKYLNKPEEGHQHHSHH